MNFWVAFGLFILATAVVIFALSINGKTDAAAAGDGHGHDDHGHGGHGHH